MAREAHSGDVFKALGMLAAPWSGRLSHLALSRPGHQPVGKPGATTFPSPGLRVPVSKKRRLDIALYFSNGVLFSFSRFLKQNAKRRPNTENTLQGPLLRLGEVPGAQSPTSLPKMVPKAPQGTQAAM